MQLCTSEPHKELQTFPRLPIPVSSLPYAFSLIKHTGTNALTKHSRELCSEGLKGRKRPTMKKSEENL